MLVLVLETEVAVVPALFLVGRDVAVAQAERVEEEVADCRVAAQAVSLAL